MSDLKYGIMSSGRLGAICTEQLIDSKRVNFVLTDKLSDAIIDLCNKNNIPVFIGNPRNEKIAEFLENFATDILLSINYLYIVTEVVINHAKKYAINLHGSLLPKYRGRTPHVWAIINNENETGISAHLISDECDSGSIIYQEAIKIDTNDTGSSVLEKFMQRYPVIINKVIGMIDDNSIKPIQQDHTKATYFGKRTALDGEINWNWQRERLNNWIRAQAYPYPGAFTFYENKKVVVQRIEFSDQGFTQEDANGKILDSGQMIVKTPNGAVKIVEMENDDKMIFETGKLFHAGH